MITAAVAALGAGLVTLAMICVCRKYACRSSSSLKWTGSASDFSDIAIASSDSVVGVTLAAGSAPPPPAALPSK